MAKKVLITGASGFIGKNLLEGLAEDYAVYAPGRNELNLLDVIIHSANTNNTRNKQTTAYDSLDGNLRMFFNLERCHDSFGKMYYFGSGAEYANRHYSPSMKEEYFGTYMPQDSYGFSKYIMSRTCENSKNIYDLRLFGVYGKYEEWERRFISNAICRVLKGKDITIRQNVYFDYLWIDDLVDIMKWFIEHEPKHKQYNVCRGSKIDLYSLAGIVKETLSSNCDILVGEEGLKPEYTGDNRRLLQELGSYSFTGFEESIRDLCDYYKKHIELIQEELL